MEALPRSRWNSRFMPVAIASWAHVHPVSAGARRRRPTVTVTIAINDLHQTPSRGSTTAV